jgi:hypothetical protein
MHVVLICDVKYVRKSLGRDIFRNWVIPVWDSIYSSPFCASNTTLGEEVDIFDIFDVEINIYDCRPDAKAGD